MRSSDWSSDVCSSDLLDAATVTDPGQYGIRLRKVSDQSLVALSAIAVSGSGDIVATAAGALPPGDSDQVESGQDLAALSAGLRSEERRVGNERGCRCR